MIDQSYKGQGKWSAGITSFIASIAAIEIGGIAIASAWFKARKQAFSISEIFIDSLKDWRCRFLPVVVGVGVGMHSYFSALKAKNEHDQLLNDNIAMRQQLNQTGQILNHVAGQIQQGGLKDSELTVSDAAPPSHVAKLEAAKAQHVLADAEASHGAHAHHEKAHGSHAAAIANQRADAAEAAPTLH